MSEDREQGRAARLFALGQQIVLDVDEHGLGSISETVEKVVLPLIRAFEDEVRERAYRAGLRDGSSVGQRAIEEALDRQTAAEEAATVLSLKLGAAEAGKREAEERLVRFQLGWLNGEAPDCTHPGVYYSTQVARLEADVAQLREGKREAEEKGRLDAIAVEQYRVIFSRTGEQIRELEAEVAQLTERARKAENGAEVMQDDLAALLRALGMGDHARPQSPHEVMLEAVAEVAQLKAEVAEYDRQFQDHLVGCPDAQLKAERDEAQRRVEDLAGAATKLCMWIRHTVPEWTTEVDKYLEATEAALAQGAEPKLKPEQKALVDRWAPLLERLSDGAEPKPDPKPRMVGCETEDGLIKTHPEDQTCDVCANWPKP